MRHAGSALGPLDDLKQVCHQSAEQLGALVGQGVPGVGDEDRGRTRIGLDQLLLPRRQHNNIAPRLIKRIAQWTGRGRSSPRDWTLGTLFQLGYGANWGVVLGLARYLTGAWRLRRGRPGLRGTQ